MTDPVRRATVGASLVAAAVLLAGGCREGRRTFESPLVLGGREVPAATLNRGEFLYMHHCRGCHGPRGAGDGPYAASLEPPPRDLTAGVYARIETEGDALPTDGVLVALLRRGVDGTAMRPLHLPEESLDAIVQYVKTLSPRWAPAAGPDAQDVQ